MGWGDTAKAALEKALEAYKAVVEVQVVVGHVQRAVEAFEKRITDRLDAHDRRTDDRIDRLEARVREMETRVASLGGKVDGAFAEAVKVVLLDPETKRKLAGSHDPHGTDSEGRLPVLRPPQ